MKFGHINLYYWLHQHPSVRLLTHNYLGFPAQEMHVLAGNAVRICYGGLVGVDSPLPPYLIEAALQQPHLADALALYNAHYYRLLYQVWHDYHPLYQKQYNHYLAAISGLMGVGMPWFLTVLPFAMRGRSISLLQQALQAVLPRCVVGCEVLPGWVGLAEVKGLGHGLRLGDNACLGQRMWFAVQRLSITIRGDEKRQVAFAPIVRFFCRLPYVVIWRVAQKRRLLVLGRGERLLGSRCLYLDGSPRQARG